MNLNELIFGMMFVFVGVLSFGSFYAAGAPTYGVANTTDYLSLDNSSILYGTITDAQDVLGGSDIESNAGVGYVLKSAYIVGKGIITGEYLTVGINLVMNMIGITGIAIPAWVSIIITMMLIFAFIVGTANIFLAGKGI